MKEFQPSNEQNNLSHRPQNERSTTPDGDPFVKEEIDIQEPWFKKISTLFKEEEEHTEKENDTLPGEPSLNALDETGEPQPPSNIEH